MYGKLTTTGYLQSGNKHFEGAIELTNFAKDEQDNYYEVYKTDGSNEPDIIAIQAINDTNVLVEVKEAKDEELKVLTSTVNGVVLDSSTESINYMGSVVAIANAKYNKLVQSGIEPSVAYIDIYKSTVVWRNANNKNSTIQIESIVEALELAMTSIGSIKTGS